MEFASESAGVWNMTRERWENAICHFEMLSWSGIELLLTYVNQYDVDL